MKNEKKDWINRNDINVHPVLNKRGVYLLIAGMLGTVFAAQAFHACQDSVEGYLFEKNTADTTQVENLHLKGENTEAMKLHF